jgi:hypothetical protein
VLEVDVDALAPEVRVQLLARHQVARPLDQEGQQLEGLALERNPTPRALQLAGAEIEPERSEADPGVQWQLPRRRRRRCNARVGAVKDASALAESSPGEGPG